MSPFAVASKSYAVKGAIAYESQLITAVVNTRSRLKGRLKVDYYGDGNELDVTELSPPTDPVRPVVEDERTLYLDLSAFSTTTELNTTDD